MDESTRRGVKIGIILIGLIFWVAVGITAVFVTLSFSYVEYYEYGFVREKSSADVDTSKVYTMGKYFVGPGYDFKVYPRNAQTIQLERVAVFTADRLEARVNVSLQYALRKRDLAFLHRDFKENYNGYIVSNITDVIKIEMTRFRFRDVIQKRSDIEQALFKAIHKKLSGSCCPDPGACEIYKLVCEWMGYSRCPFFQIMCPDDCLKQENCTYEDMGMFVGVPYFQLGYIAISSDVTDRFLMRLTLSFEMDKEQYLQEAMVIRKETEGMVNLLHNAASETIQSASSEAEQIRNTAWTKYNTTIEQARSTALAKLYEMEKQDSQNTSTTPAK